MLVQKFSHLLKPILLLAILVLFSGCPDGKAPVQIEPVDDPAEAMIAQAVLVEGTMLVALDELRVKLNVGQGELVDEDFISQDAIDVLDGIVANTNGDVYASGILDTNGTIVNVEPEEYVNLVGTSWANRPEVDDALAEPRLEIGAPFEVNSDWTVLYTRSIVKSSEIQGVLFALFDLDSLFTRNAEFAGIDTVANREFFALDQTSRVLFSTLDGYTGTLFDDPGTYSEDQVAVAESMTVPDSIDGSATLDLSGSPGGDGERYLGWVHMPLVNDRYWVLAASLPVEDQE